MEARHGASFLAASRANGVEPDREFADGELGYLIEQVDRYAAERDFDALAVLQGFIVESLDHSPRLFFNRWCGHLLTSLTLF